MKCTAIAAVSAVALAGCVGRDAETYEAPPAERPGTAAPGEATPTAAPVARVSGCIIYRIVDGSNTVYATTPSGAGTPCALAVVHNKDS